MYSKKYYFNVYEFLTLLEQNSVTDVSVGFRPPCWCPSGWAPAWRLQIWVKHSRIRNIPLTLESWRESLHSYLLLFPRFWTLSIERVWFLFWSILNGVTLKTSMEKLNFGKSPRAFFSLSGLPMTQRSLYGGERYQNEKWCFCFDEPLCWQRVVPIFPQG